MEGESAEQNLLVLHALARNCEYGQLREELIRDRTVIGILDKALSKRLQLDPGLMLEKAARMVRQSECVGEQQLVLKGQRDSDKEGVEADVNRMNSMGKVAQQKNSSSSCTRCRNQHETGKCPAQKVTCFRFHKRGHFQSQCFSQRTPQKVLDKETNSVQGEVETVFLGPVEEAKSSWEGSGMAKILLYLKKITRKYEVEESWLNFQRYCEAIKPVVGSLAKSEKHQIFVVKGLKNNLLGFPATCIRSMGLVVRVNEITSSFKGKILDTVVYHLHSKLVHSIQLQWFEVSPLFLR
eukprot:Em0009g755a